MKMSLKQIIQFDEQNHQWMLWTWVILFLIWLIYFVLWLIQLARVLVCIYRIKRLKKLNDESA